MALDDKAIKEVNSHISDALKQWADIMLLADADNWAYKLNYIDEDALNSIFIVNHVLMNVAIKSGYIKDEKDAMQKGNAFRNAIKEYCGIDTYEVVNKVLRENKENGIKS